MKPALVKTSLVNPLVLVLAPVLAGACHNVYYVESKFSVDLREEASRTEDKPLTFQAGDALAVDLPSGAVTIRGTASETPSYRARITVRGKSQEEAAENLKKVEVKTGRDGRGVAITVDTSAVETAGGRGIANVYTTVKLEISVPEGTRLDLRTGSGDVKAGGAIGASTVTTNYGSVQLSDVKGDARIQSKSGSVTCERVNGAKIVEVKSGYGAVKVLSCETERLECESSSGDVSIQDVKTSEIELKTQYGRVDARRVKGSIQAKTASGDVTVDDAADGQVTAESGYGAVRIRKVNGAVRAKTSSGEVAVTDVQGAVEASSSYGNVKIDGILTNVQAKSSSGAVSIDARTGSVPAGSWSATSGYGAVSIALPSTVTGTLDARTSYGSVDSDFPVLLEAGVKAKGNALKGILNPLPNGKTADNGFTLTASSSSGDVKIRKS